MRSLRASLALAGILLLAAFLRFTSIGFDLDLRDPERTLIDNHYDARAMVRDLQRALSDGSLAPGSFLYRGPAGFLAFGAADVLAVAVLAARHPGGRAGVLADLEANPALLALLHRCVSALAGVLTVLALARLVAREFGKPAGLCAGLVLAVSYLHVRDSHLGTVDVLWGLVLVLALDACFRVVADPRPGTYARAGFLAGAAVATKYFSVVLGLHLLLAHFMGRARAKAEGRAPPGLGPLATMLALAPVAFLLFFPGLFLGAARDFVERVAFGADALEPRWDGISQLRMLRFHLLETAGVGLGEPVLVAACVGMALAWRRGTSGRYLVLAVLILVPMLFLTNSTFVRYGMGFMVVLAAPAGVALGEAFRVRPALGAGLLAVAVAPSLVRSVALDRVWQASDTRILALAELRARCASGDRVVAVGFHHDKPLPTQPQPFEFVNLLTASHRGKLRAEDVLADPPRWLLFGLRIPMDLYPRGAELAELARTRYRAVAVLGDPEEAAIEIPPETVPISILIPWERPWAVERPGPPMILYERVD